MLMLYCLLVLMLTSLVCYDVVVDIDVIVDFVVGDVYFVVIVDDVVRLVFLM